MIVNWSIVADIAPYKVPVNWGKVVVETVRYVMRTIPWWVWLIMISFLLFLFLHPRGKTAQELGKDSLIGAKACLTVHRPDPIPAL